MFGLFFEDINFAADEGLYPKLVKNRSFELQQRMLRLGQPRQRVELATGVEAPHSYSLAG